MGWWAGSKAGTYLGNNFKFQTRWQQGLSLQLAIEEFMSFSKPLHLAPNNRATLTWICSCFPSTQQTSNALYKGRFRLQETWDNNGVIWKPQSISFDVISMTIMVKNWITVIFKKLDKVQNVRLAIIFFCTNKKESVQEYLPSADTH